MSTSSTVAQAAPQSVRLSLGYSWYVVGVLVVAYTFSYVDRTILTLMVGPIRTSLGINDVQVSLLHGLAFAIFYTLLGIPIARYADTMNRTWIISIGIGVWSIMTALCGFARNFWEMFLARIGVGVGEAALSPGAYSLLADYFPKRRMPLALSIYTSAAYAGSGLAIMIGGALITLMPAIDLPGVGHLEPWQGVFVAIGLPGVLVALAVLLLREPPRTSVKAGIAPGIGELFAHLGRHRGAYLVTILGYALSSMLWNGSMAWFPTFFMRSFGWTTAEVGLRFGLTLVAVGTAGVVLGAMLTTALRDRGRADAHLLVALLALAIAVPFGLIGTLASSQWLALAGIGVFLFATCMPWGCAPAALQEITPNQMRGQVSAIYLFFINLFGMGLGPTAVAFCTDSVFRNDAALGQSLALTMAVAAPLSALVLWCARRPYREAVARIDF